MRIDINVNGDREFIRALAGLGAQMRPTLATALYIEHELIMTVAKERCPVLTGALRASGQVHQSTITSDGVTSIGGFGNTAVEYAVYVHERLDLRHPVGQAKYYESAAMNAVPGMADRLTERLRRVLGLG